MLQMHGIFGDLNKAKTTCANCNAEVTYIAKKFWKVNYPFWLINVIANNFIKSKKDLED